MSRAILFTVPFQALAMVLLASCAATPIVPVDSHPNAPQVFSIGDSSVITYKPDRDLYLTVTGSHLDESSSEINVSVSGECPGLPSEVTVVERKFSQFQIKFEEGKAALQNKDKAEAIKAFEAALKFAPGHTETLKLLKAAKELK